MKKFGLIALLSVLTFGLVACGGESTTSAPTPAEMPVAWGADTTYANNECSITLVPGSIEGQGADVKAVKDYLRRSDVRCFDLRDSKEGYGVGHIEGFESVSYFNVLVGTGEQLFYSTDNGFAPRYTQSETILNSIFPKDAKIFAMCAVGGRVQPFCTLLKQYGYNMDNVYNVGGWKQVNAADNFGGYQVSRGIAAKEITYDFSSLTPAAAPKAVKRAASNEVPAAWGADTTYANNECSVTLVPGSIEGQGADVKAVKDYLRRSDVRCFDLRDSKEGYGVGHIEGFESVSYFNVLVGTGEQLFYSTDNGFAPRYTQSETILNSIFPKDAKIFAMCAVGGRVQPFCTLLKQYGYNMDNVYNVGGWKQVNAADNFGGYQVSRGIAAKEITYDFSSLTPVDA